MIIIYILLAVVAVIAVWVVGIYNKLVQKRILAEEGWSGIDVQLKRRYDLIPNLIETVKGYAEHEKSTFEEVTKMRAAAKGAGTVAEKGKAEGMLSGALMHLFAVAENYPDLKANQNFLELQNDLSTIEEEIQLSRRYYNGTVRELNTSVDVFPNNIIASKFAFEKKEFFELENEAEKVVPKVSFK